MRVIRDRKTDFMLSQLLAAYPAVPDSFDEMLDDANQPRAHWRTMLDSLAVEAPDMMRQRLETVQRQVRENGVTYNVYADAEGMARPWDLNVLPLILPHDEWADIEAAVIQRATLLNRILLDVYGEQDMLKEGLLPPALIHGHAGFLRPCHGMRHQDDIALHFYAIDLARAPNGQWWVVADRTQAPSGAGYALENRSVIARVFPDLLRELKVRHLEGFFNTMRDSLAHWGRLCAANGNGGAPLREAEAPLIVLLTPGPYNETYYEQTFLARHLGLPLVEGSDLTVRNGIVWLKTLSGMQRVHIIMRRVDDDFCDPLELRTDSALGVAGLLDAARRGNVLIANSLGSSLLESGALLGFLPGLCERLLGEPLKMPSVATWWCGQPDALDEAIERLDRLVIKPAFPQLRQAPVFGQDVKGEARAALIRKMRANPSNYVGQELVRLSQAPVWKLGAAGAGSLGASGIGLRVYACATPNGYVVMPGGLTRVATGPDARVITMQQGGGSKDTWIQSDAQVGAHSALKRTITSADLIRDDTHLSSRMAENLFWLGRNAERYDNIARLMRVTLNFLFNVRPEYRGDEWPTVKGLCTWFHLIEPAPAPKTAPQHASQSQSQSQGKQSQSQVSVPAPASLSDARIEAALLLAVVSPDVPGLACQQQQLYRTASHLRERLSVDNWRALNRMMQRAGGSSTRPSQSEAMSILDDAAGSSMAMAGFAVDGMTRDLGWRFLSIGRRLERLQFQSMVLKRALGMTSDGSLDWLLELSDSIVTYRARYRSQPEWLPVLDLLLLDESNPRSILFQLQGILKSLHKLARNYGPCGDKRLEPLKDELLALVPETDLYCGNAHLIDLLYRIKLTSDALSERISVQFFSYTGKHQPKAPA
jgi:uncharacterized circularly permuted ATP-grasp superfamily protein/uncharacterized alpha-E superfamily protein